METVAFKDQENLVHNVQPGAHGKPLHASFKGLGAKTPGNKAPKTPYKLSLNDENGPGKAGKSVLKPNGKGNDILGTTAKKDGKIDNNAFVTPAGPRTRAPLGMKTTNAKATAFKTPAPFSASAKTQKASPRLRRPKVKVHQPEAQPLQEDDVPEIEYMPPKEIPLPDDMDDYLPRDWKFPMFEGENATRGIWETFHNPMEDDGRRKLEREFEEGLERDKKKRDEEFDKLFAQQWESDQAEVDRHFGGKPLATTKAIPKPTVRSEDPTSKTTGLSTVKARSAVSALAAPRKPTFAAPTTATKSRLPGPTISSKKPIAQSSTTRHALATAASKSTIGYAQGRAARPGPKAPPKPLPFSTTLDAARRPPTASTARDRAASSASSSMTGIASRPRGPFSRSSSTSTNATLVAAPQDQQAYRTADDVQRELERMVLGEQDADASDDDEAWMESFAAQLSGGGGSDLFDEDLEDFQMQLPAGL